MPVKFGSILHVNNSGSEASMDANNLRGTTLQIDSFNSESLAKIGTGLLAAPGKRRLGTIVSTTGSYEYYLYSQSGSDDPLLSGPEWTTLSNWKQIATTDNVVLSLPTGLISGSDHIFTAITASGNVSASGKLFFSSSLNSSTALKTLMYDTATGQIFHTGSYGGGGGGGGTGAGFPFEGDAVITGSLIVSGTADQDIEIFNDILPGVSDEYTLGTSTKKWNAVFATNTFFGGIHEINLETTGISQLQTGTILVSKAGQMVPCDTKGDALVMGVVTSGSDYPVIMGAEPVLVDGPVYEGDYIITSNRIGYGTAVAPDKIYEQRLFGKIIAQSLETNLLGGSVKAMIRKM